MSSVLHVSLPTSLRSSGNKALAELCLRVSKYELRDKFIRAFNAQFYETDDYCSSNH